MRPNRLGLFAAALCLGYAATASTFQSTTQMNVSLTREVPQVTVSATALEFGTTAVGGNIDATSTITISATANLSYQIALDRGSQAIAGEERMMSSATTPERVPYQLYSDAGHTSQWGDDGLTYPAPSVAGLGTAGTTQQFPVFGRAVVPASLPGGTFNDIVTVSVLF